MGRTTTTTDTADNRPERYSLHFPRVFAYAYGVTGDEETAKEATIAAFSTVLPAQFLEEHDFVQALYTAARKLGQAQRTKAKDGLTASEREIISLLFDAQLTKAEVCELLRLDQASVLTTLVGGLRKLQATMPATKQAQRLQTLSA